MLPKQFERTGGQHHSRAEQIYHIKTGCISHHSYTHIHIV